MPAAALKCWLGSLNLTEGLPVFGGLLLFQARRLRLLLGGGDGGPDGLGRGGAHSFNRSSPMRSHSARYAACSAAIFAAFLAPLELPKVGRRSALCRASFLFQAFPGGLGEGMDSRQQFRLCLGAECLLPVDVSAMLAQVGQNDIRDPLAEAFRGFLAAGESKGVQAGFVDDGDLLAAPKGVGNSDSLSSSSSLATASR